MNNPCKDLRKHATKILKSEENLKNEENQPYYEQNICYICKKEFSINDKKYYKVRDHCHYTRKYRSAAHNIYNLRCKHQEKFL